jgi:hypothetical protein
MQASDIAWQPFTPGGVAAFARARHLHLLIVQLLTALVSAGTVLWFLSSAWFPVIDSAVHQLPPAGEIRSGRLAWPGEPAVMLAENHFLALSVDLQHAGQVRSPAHVQLEFGRADLRMFSLLGMAQASYPAGWTVAFSREELVPWWGAWAPMLLAIAGVGLVFCLFAGWFLVATLYCPVAWLAGFFADRDLSLRAAWRLASAALIPGALFLDAAVVLYGLGALDVVRLLFAVVAHFAIGWVYLLISPFCCPPHPALAAKGSPFARPDPGSAGVPGSVSAARPNDKSNLDVRSN